MIYLALAIAGLGFIVLGGVYHHVVRRSRRGEPGTVDDGDLGLW